MGIIFQVLRSNLSLVLKDQSLLYLFHTFLKEEGAINVLQFCLAVGKLACRYPGFDFLDCKQMARVKVNEWREVSTIQLYLHFLYIKYGTLSALEIFPLSFLCFIVQWHLSLEVVVLLFVNVLLVSLSIHPCILLYRGLQQSHSGSRSEVRTT